MATLEDKINKDIDYLYNILKVDDEVPFYLAGSSSLILFGYQNLNSVGVKKERLRELLNKYQIGDYDIVTDSYAITGLTKLIKNGFLFDGMTLEESKSYLEDDLSFTPDPATRGLKMINPRSKLVIDYISTSYKHPLGNFVKYTTKSGNSTGLILSHLSNYNIPGCDAYGFDDVYKKVWSVLNNLMMKDKKDILQITIEDIEANINLEEYSKDELIARIEKAINCQIKREIYGILSEIINQTEERIERENEERARSKRVRTSEKSFLENSFLGGSRKKTKKRKVKKPKKRKSRKLKKSKKKSSKNRKRID